MKVILTALIITGGLGPAAAYGGFEPERVSVGGRIVYNTWLGEIDAETVSESRSGAGVTLEGRYRVSPELEAGAEIGYLPWYRYDFRFTAVDVFLQPREVTAEVSYYSIPVMGTVRYSFPDAAGSGFTPRVEGAFGFHRTVSRYRERINGVDFSTVTRSLYPALGLGGGVEYRVNDSWAADLNLRFTFVLTPGGASSLITPGAGVSWRFF